MIDTKHLATLHSAATADNTEADEYRVAVDAALPGLLKEVEELRRDKERLEERFLKLQCDLARTETLLQRERSIAMMRGTK